MSDGALTDAVRVLETRTRDADKLAGSGIGDAGGRSTQPPGG